ncbi:9843_t:CDS:1, partial [Dentiscutata erythropus]
NVEELLKDLNELLKSSPVTNKIISPSYEQSSELQNKIITLWRSLARARRLKNRINILVCAFYLGQLLETVTKQERTMCNKLLTRYFIMVSVRTYYIFEKLGVEQICRTSTMNLRMISRLESREFQNLVKLTDLMKDELINVDAKSPQETILEENDHYSARSNSAQFEDISQYKFLIHKEDFRKLVPIIFSPKIRCTLSCKICDY